MADSEGVERAENKEYNARCGVGGKQPRGHSYESADDELALIA